MADKFREPREKHSENWTRTGATNDAGKLLTGSIMVIAAMMLLFDDDEDNGSPPDENPPS